MKSGIYWIVGPTGKAYIGSSQNIEKRLRQHRNELVRGVHANAHLQRAFDKYGVNAFLFTPLEFCAVERLIEREQHHIDSFDFDTLYNARPIAESNRGVKRAPDVRAAMSERARKRLATAEARAAHGERIKAAFASPEARAAISARAKAACASPEARAAMSERARKQLASPEARAAHSERLKAAFASPEARAANSERVRKHFANPEARAAASERLLLRYSNPAELAAQIEHMRKLASDPEERAARSERAQKRLANPDERAAMAAAVSAARNTSGYRGVSRRKDTGKWVACTKLNGKNRHLGGYATPELAYTWRLAYLAHLEYA